MSVGLEPTIVAEARAMSFGFVVTAPMQKQTPATKPTEVAAMFSAAGRSLMSSNVKLRGGEKATLLRSPSRT